MKARGREIEGAYHESRDADVFNLFLVVTMLLLVVGVCLLVCWFVMQFLSRGQPAPATARVQMATPVATFPEPKLLTYPGKERAERELAGRTKLETYGWVDRRTGVARIPIDRAMLLLLKRGLPEVGAGQTRLQLMQARPETDLQPSYPIGSPTP
jgi:hypothetical protein